MVEFAIVVTVLSLLLLGVIDLGRVFHTYTAIANAAREGARYCALHQADATRVADTRTRVRNELSGVSSFFTGIIMDDDTTTSYYSSKVLISPSTSPTTCPDPDSNYSVTVTVRANFTPVTPLIGNLIGNPSAVVATATMGVP